MTILRPDLIAKREELIKQHQTIVEQIQVMQERGTMTVGAIAVLNDLIKKIDDEEAAQYAKDKAEAEANAAAEARVSDAIEADKRANCVDRQLALV